jgi:DNA-binding IclR family transcriptional regulator
VDLYLLSQKNTVYTNKKLINLTEFIQNLRRVRKQGYGFSDEEIARGVRALAAPVRDSKGNVVVDYRNEFANFRIAEL